MGGNRAHPIQDSLPAPDAEPIPNFLGFLMQFLNAAMARAIPYVPNSLIDRAARRYVAGLDLSHALPRIQRLNLEGFPVTIDVLGESVTPTAHADAMVNEYETCLPRSSASTLYSLQRRRLVSRALVEYCSLLTSVQPLIAAHRFASRQNFHRPVP